MSQVCARACDHFFDANEAVKFSNAHFLSRSHLFFFLFFFPLLLLGGIIYGCPP